MSDYALPSSLRLELEARRMHSTARVARPADTKLGLMFSGFPQALDLFVWAAAAVLVFPSTIFQGLERTAAILAGLALWALAYGMRPAGALLFGALRRRHGSGVALTASRFLLAGFTVSVAFLPATPGAGAIALLAGVRALQGVAMGGVSGGREPRAGRLVDGLMAGLAGLIVAGGVFAAFGAVLDRPDFLDWGWRYPFVMAIPANIAALFADLRLLTTGPGTTDGRAVARLVSTRDGAVDRNA